MDGPQPDRLGKTASPALMRSLQRLNDRLWASNLAKRRIAPAADQPLAMTALGKSESFALQHLEGCNRQHPQLNATRAERWFHPRNRSPDRGAGRALV